MNPTAKKSSGKESPTVFWMPPLSSETLEHLSSRGILPSFLAVSTWLQEVSPVSHSQSPAKDLENQIPGTCGLPPSSAFASYDRLTSSWRTSQGSLLTNTWEEFSETWPRAGIVSDGLVWEQTMLADSTEENEFGFSHIPTPTASDGTMADRGFRKTQVKEGSLHLIGLKDYLRLLPTPNSTDGMRTRFTPIQIMKEKESHARRGVQLGSYLARTLAEDSGVSQTPTFTEDLMGWPIGWTDLKPLETDKFLSAWLTPFQFYLKELLNEI